MASKPLIRLVGAALLGFALAGASAAQTPGTKSSQDLTIFDRVTIAGRYYTSADEDEGRYWVDACNTWVCRGQTVVRRTVVNLSAELQADLHLRAPVIARTTAVSYGLFTELCGKLEAERAMRLHPVLVSDFFEGPSAPPFTVSLTRGDRAHTFTVFVASNRTPQERVAKVLIDCADMELVYACLGYNMKLVSQTLLPSQRGHDLLGRSISQQLFPGRADPTGKRELWEDEPPSGRGPQSTSSVSGSTTR